MSEISLFDAPDTNEQMPSDEEVKKLCDELRRRCNAAKIEYEEFEPSDEGDISSRIGIKSGRDQRWLYCWSYKDYLELLSIEFERYTFLTGLNAICSYDKGLVEAIVKPISGIGVSRNSYRRLLGIILPDGTDSLENYSINLESHIEPKTTISLSSPTKEMTILAGRISRPYLSLKIQRDGIKQQDQAEEILKKLSDALFFQIDLLTDVPLFLVRDRRSSRTRPKRNPQKNQIELIYLTVEYDSAPISLYWYARSAVGMPLLQFLAFYQVIEFYYNTYSEAEARRRLKKILKNPTFRGDPDADIGKILSTIQVTKTGAVGDERSQLKATLNECIDPESLRDFLLFDKERMDFFSSKTKYLPVHKLPLSNPNVDLRNDVADRLYEIRCKIVHTKLDPRTGDLELLLPFSKEADQLHFDIELIQYLEQQILVSTSTSI
ncbi:MAG: hypothetical protein HGB06_09600 [Chlorobaculum sp.]|jgi:hypothetical protein|nr:hypothetical protein [Chlorobaculum sp.]